MSVPYIHTAEVHNLSAPSEVVPLIMRIVNPASVLDIGCGTGTWLRVFSDHGVQDYMGIDRHGLTQSELLIPKEKFVGADLRTTIVLNKKFDLALSLEVAEHLPAAFADIHVESLVSHSDVILFSAAIPNQGGQDHLNEQWPSWWQEKFRKHGFYFHDTIRPLIWSNDKVDWWYRQNMFLVTKKKNGSIEKIIPVVHPAFLNALAKRNDEKISEIVEGKQGMKLGLRVLMNSIFFKVKSLFR